MPSTKSDALQRLVSVAVTSLLVLIALLAPFAWILRDGLGPDATESSGLRAVQRAFMTFYWGPIAIMLVAAKVAVVFWAKTTDQPAKPLRTWRSTAMWTAGVLLAAGTTCGVMTICRVDRSGSSPTPVAQRGPRPAKPASASTVAPPVQVAKALGPAAALNTQIDEFNANRPRQMGVSPIEKRVSRVEYDGEEDALKCFDDTNDGFLTLKRQPDGQFGGTLQVKFHEPAEGDKWRWGHVIATFTLPGDQFHKSAKIGDKPAPEGSDFQKEAAEKAKAEAPMQ
jgi:hypothetical protein